MASLSEDDARCNNYWLLAVCKLLRRRCQFKVHNMCYLSKRVSSKRLLISYYVSIGTTYK